MRRTRRRADPLAELARLIGQTDPFADTCARRAAAQRRRARSTGTTPRDWRRHAAHDAAPPTSRDRRRARRRARPTHDTGRCRADPRADRALCRPLSDPRYAIQHAGARPYRLTYARQPDHVRRSACGPTRTIRQPMRPPAIRRAGLRRRAPRRYPHEPRPTAMPPPHDDEVYDDPPRRGAASSAHRRHADRLRRDRHRRRLRLSHLSARRRPAPSRRR